MKFCPYCNSDKGLILKYFSDYSDECFSANLNDPNIYEHTGRMFVSECSSCRRLILSDDFGGSLEPNLAEKATILYPNLLLSHAVPEEIRVTYSLAKRIQRLNTDAFIMQLRKCLEISCNLQGYNKGNLVKKFSCLCKDLSLPHSLVEIGKQIRLFGNLAAHEFEDFHPVTCQSIDEFFLILMDYIYILPSKVEWFKNFNNKDRATHPGYITLDGKWVIKRGKFRE